MSDLLTPETLCAHAGAPRTLDGAGPSSHVAPLHQVSVFDFPSIEASLPALAGDGYAYRRIAMPNADELGAAVAALEGGEAGLATASGMGAIVSLVLGAASAGDRVVVQRDAYGGTHGFLRADLARLGVTIDTIDAYDPAAVATAARGARLVLVETVSNPLLRCPDVAALAAVCRDAGALLCVDNTFGTPLRDRPLAAGAHAVVHSVTKFLGGHHDLCAGAVVGDRELIATARGVSQRLGLGAAPLDAWLAVRGIRTLAVRMERAWASCEALGAHLAAHPRVERVHRAERCALVSFDVGSRAAAERVVERLQLITLSPSLGGVVTTISHPATSSHAPLTADERRAAGIGDGLLRISVGLEAVEDLWRDLEAAL